MRQFEPMEEDEQDTPDVDKEESKQEAVKEFTKRLGRPPINREEPKPQVQYIERVVTLELLNEKLNYLVSKLDSIAK